MGDGDGVWFLGSWETARWLRGAEKLFRVKFCRSYLSLNGTSRVVLGVYQAIGWEGGQPATVREKKEGKDQESEIYPS